MKNQASRFERTHQILGLMGEGMALDALSQDQDSSEKDRPLLEQQLEEVRRRPFATATSMQDLLDKVVLAYPEAVGLLIKLRRLNPIAAEARLVAIRMASQGFQEREGCWDDWAAADLTSEGSAPPKLLSALTTFEFSAHPIVPPCSVFPRLNVGNADGTFGASLRAEAKPEEVGNIAFYLLTEVFIAHMDVLSKRYAEYTELLLKLPHLQETETALMEQALRIDDKYTRATSDVQFYENEIRRAELARRGAQAVQEKARHVVQQRVLKDIPGLVRYNDLRQTFLF